MRSRRNFRRATCAVLALLLCAAGMGSAEAGKKKRKSKSDVEIPKGVTTEHVRELLIEQDAPVELTVKSDGEKYTYVVNDEGTRVFSADFQVSGRCRGFRQLRESTVKIVDLPTDPQLDPGMYREPLRVNEMKRKLARQVHVSGPLTEAIKRNALNICNDNLALKQAQGMTTDEILSRPWTISKNRQYAAVFELRCSMMEGPVHSDEFPMIINYTCETAPRAGSQSKPANEGAPPDSQNSDDGTGVPVAVDEQGRTS